MTELQMGLIGLGAVAVVGVLAYNKWQESKHRKIAERMMTGQHADVLLGDSSAHEASVNADAYDEYDFPHTPVEVPEKPVELITRIGGQRVEPGMRKDTRIEPAIDKVTRDTEMPPEVAIVEPAEVYRAARAEFPPAQVVDETPDTPHPGDSIEAGFPFDFLSPLIDYVACFEAIQPASARQILESQRDFLVRVRKPIHWLGYNERRLEWELISENGQVEYRRLCIGMQLVDRSGPAREGDLSVFHLAMQDLAEELMAVVDLPPRDQVLEAAAQLDGFSAGVDIQIGLNVLSQGIPFAGTKLRALAEAAGMSIDSNGHFVRRDDDGNVLYRLLNQEEAAFAADTIRSLSTHGITFLLDVPRVAHGDRVFSQMLDLARRFAEALQGSLVDDNRRPLSEGQLEPIRRQIGEYQIAMAARNLPAGGHLALRLFS